MVFLWAHTADTARRADVTALRRDRRLAASTLVLGGPGWPPGTTGQVHDLAGAVRACTAPVLPTTADPGGRPGPHGGRPGLPRTSDVRARRAEHRRRA